MKKRFTDEQIISILREAESKEIATVDLCKRHNITEQTFYRWRNKLTTEVGVIGAAGLDSAQIDVAACAHGELGGSELLQNGLLQP